MIQINHFHTCLIVRFDTTKQKLEKQYLHNLTFGQKSKYCPNLFVSRICRFFHFICPSLLFAETIMNYSTLAFSANLTWQTKLISNGKLATKPIQFHKKGGNYPVFRFLYSLRVSHQGLPHHESDRSHQCFQLLSKYGRGNDMDGPGTSGGFAGVLVSNLFLTETYYRYCGWCQARSIDPSRWTKIQILTIDLRSDLKNLLRDLNSNQVRRVIRTWTSNDRVESYFFRQTLCMHLKTECAMRCKRIFAQQSYVCKILCKKT